MDTSFFAKHVPFASLWECSHFWGEAYQNYHQGALQGCLGWGQLSAVCQSFADVMATPISPSKDEAGSAIPLEQSDVPRQLVPKAETFGICRVCAGPPHRLGHIFSPGASLPRTAWSHPVSTRRPVSHHCFYPLQVVSPASPCKHFCTVEPSSIPSQVPCQAKPVSDSPLMCYIDLTGSSCSQGW